MTTEDSQELSARLRARAELFELANDLLATFDRTGLFADLNLAWERTLGWSREELLGRRALELVHPDDLERTFELYENASTSQEVIEFENRYQHKDGGYRWLQWNARLSDEHWYAVARDVTDRRRLEEQAVRDPLTGLPNRVALTERLAQAILRLERHPGLVAILFIDLDHFKVINDGRGHKAGDRFLRAVASRLVDTVRGPDAVARFGGDEFVVLIEDASRAIDLTEVAGRVVQALGEPIVVDGDEAVIGASVGIAVTSDPTPHADALLHDADTAMYRAKARGGGCVELFSDAMRAEVDQRLEAELALRAAVDKRQLVLHYQPVVALPECTVARCEALVRWQHPSEGLLLPARFLGLAEETGLILKIGEWVLGEACRQAARWRAEDREIAVSVNVSTRQLDQPEFTEQVRRALADSRLPPSALCLEITEAAMMQHLGEVAPRLEALRREGVLVAIDDFGSGYSSLTNLRRLPLDIIKIDRSLVQGMVSARQDQSLVAGIVRLGRDTGRGVIAEGVETRALHDQLLELDCHLAQGFLYGRPKPAAQLVLDGRLLTA